MGKFASLAALVVMGIIVADIIKNPAGTSAASQGAQGIEKTATNALLGVSS